MPNFLHLSTLLFAENTKSTNYLEQAYALALSIKYSQSTTTLVSLMTNDKVPKKYQSAFDKIIPIPFEVKNDGKYKTDNRFDPVFDGCGPFTGNPDESK